MQQVCDKIDSDIDDGINNCSNLIEEYANVINKANMDDNVEVLHNSNSDNIITEIKIIELLRKLELPVRFFGRNKRYY